MSAWLAVIAAAHVRRAQSLGIGQVNHGSRAGLARMHAGDVLVYYSPTEERGDSRPLRQFTAVGTIADDEIWQADEGDFHPFRRRVRYDDTTPVALAEVKDALQLTSSPNWGYQLRLGLVSLADADAGLLRASLQR